jgi:hypothetical protein
VRDVRVGAAQFQDHGERLGGIAIVIDHEDPTSDRGCRRFEMRCFRLRLGCFVRKGGSREKPPTGRSRSGRTRASARWPLLYNVSYMRDVV